MKKISVSYLKKHYCYALVDDEDFKKVSNYKWFLCSNYAATAVRKSERWQDGYKFIYMHRMINNCPDNLQVDHINADKMDNRKDNLRNVNASENQLNRWRHEHIKNPKKEKISRGYGNWGAKISGYKKRLTIDQTSKV